MSPMLDALLRHAAEDLNIDIVPAQCIILGTPTVGIIDGGRFIGFADATGDDGTPMLEVTGWVRSPGRPSPGEPFIKLANGAEYAFVARRLMTWTGPGMLDRTIREITQ